MSTLPFKKLIKTVKENHNKLKAKAEKEKLELEAKNKVNNIIVDDVTIHKTSKKGIEIKDDIFIGISPVNEKNKPILIYRVEADDNLRIISEKLYGNPNSWIMIHLKNILKIPNPDILTIGMVLDVPAQGEIQNFYDKSSKNGNYIIQVNDNIKSIAKKVFGSEKFAKKLINWNFLKFTKDIYSGKEIRGLKYLDLKRQMSLLSKKYDFKEDINYHDFVNQLIIQISSDESVPALVPLLISNTQSHWFETQINNDFKLDENLWLPLNIDERIYKSYFPRLAMDIEYQIVFSVKKFKELRQTHKNWPKAIIAYSMVSLPGVGKPEEQKKKVEEMLNILDPLILKMNNKEFARDIKNKIKFQDNEHITFDLLYKELIDYKNFCIKKYL